ncbi:MAG: purine-cytosine permease family protein [Candidatus Acidiferrales bacterium]
MTLVLMSLCVAIPSLLLGAALVEGMGLQRTITATIWGALVGTPICILAAHVGVRSRLSTAMTLKFAFGTAGSKLISAIIALDMFCWFAVNTEIFGTSLRDSTQSMWGISLAMPVLCVIAGILMTALTIFGYKAVEKFAYLAVPLLAVVLFSYLISSLMRSSFREVLARPALGVPMSYPVGISIVAGTFLSVALLMPDFTRYSKGSTQSALAVVFGLTFGFPPFVLIGAYLTAVSQEKDFVKLMLTAGWGLAAVLIIVLTCWIHMNSCLYSASLNLAAIIPRIPKWKLTMGAGLAGTCIALLGIVDRYVPFLMVLSVVLPPIASVFAADFLLRRNLYRAGSFEGVDRFRPVAVVALFAGILAGFVTNPRGQMGMGLFNLTHLPAIDSFLVAFGCQYMLGKLLAQRPKQEPEVMGESV